MKKTRLTLGKKLLTNYYYKIEEASLIPRLFDNEWERFMDDKEKFIQIFSGLERAYGQTQSRAKNDAGKIEAKSWIQKNKLQKKNGMTI